MYEDPDELTLKDSEATEIGRQKLRNFRRRLQTDLLCKFWSRDGDELARKVVSALNVAVTTDPQPGWVRGDELPVLDTDLDARLIRPSKVVGISRISPDGIAGEIMSESIAGGKDIAVISTSGARVFEIQKSYFIEAVAAGARLRVLVPELSGPFIDDVDEAENRNAEIDSINREIEVVRSRVGDIADEARTRSQFPLDEQGRVSIGFFSTHLRSTIVLCDDTWGWLTITLPPAYAAETPSLELIDQGSRSLIHASRRHFERIWTLAEERGSVEDL